MVEPLEGLHVVMGFVTQPQTLPIVLMAATVALFTWLSFRERRRAQPTARSDDSLVP